MIPNGATVFTNEEVIQIVHDLYVFKLYCLASFVLLFYDILITFGDEVEWIWRRKFNWFTVLWFLNRYLSPLGFIVITVSFQDPRWVGKACDHYVLFPEILRIFTTSITGLIFIVRLYATYSRSRTVVVIGLCFLAGELVVKIWSFLGARRLQLPPGQFGCILTSGPDNLRFTWTWIAELIFDSGVFVATFYRTYQLSRASRNAGLKSRTSLVTLILRDGLVYFVVILASNTVTTLFFLLAPKGLKPINAPFTVSITPLMVSRLVLNLRMRADETVHWTTGGLEMNDFPTDTTLAVSQPMVFHHEP